MFLTLRVVAFVRSCSSAVVDAGLAGSRCLMVSFLFPWLSDIVFAPCSAMLHGSHKAKKRMHRALEQVGQCMMLGVVNPFCDGMKLGSSTHFTTECLGLAVLRYCGCGVFQKIECSNTEHVSTATAVSTTSVREVHP